MKYSFCTLFDKNYIFRGLAMYQSMLKHCKNFELWILCMDDILYDQLKKMNLASVILVKLSDFEDVELLAVKNTRTMAEYCWTLSSSLPLYILKQRPELDMIAYLDSDLFFYSSPEEIYKEMGGDSILIVRHNYAKELAYLESRSGIYNVSLVIIRNDANGLACLKWWRERCLEWCYSRVEDGKFGDQMYLDDWQTRFRSVHVLKHKGANLAPWNINKYNLSTIAGKIYVDEDTLIFYHFHSFRMYDKNDFLNYQNFYLIKPTDEALIYSPYINALNNIFSDFENKFPDYTYGFDKQLDFKNKMKYWLKKKLFIFFYLQSLLK